jgi:hypothetical protein
MLIGEMLVQLGFINITQLEMGLSRHFKTHDKIGECLVLLGFITESKMLQVVSQQLCIPYYDVIPADCINTASSAVMSKRQASEKGIVLGAKSESPLVFLSDNLEAVQEFMAGLGVQCDYAMSRSSQIRQAIDKTYA